MNDEMIIETPEQIHALAHPMRQRILSLLYLKERTNQQIAEQLGETPPKVYFHVRELLRTGLIRLAREKANRSIVEKYYTTSAHSFRLSPLFHYSGSDEQSLFTSTFLEAYRAYMESRTYVERHLSGSTLSHQVVSLTADEANQIKEHFSAIEKIVRSAMKRNLPDPGIKAAQPFSLSYFFHPAKTSDKEAGKSH